MEARGLPLAEAIERMLIGYGSLTLSEEAIAMKRLVIRECGQFPAVATAFYEAAIPRTTRGHGRLAASTMRTPTDHARESARGSGDAARHDGHGSAARGDAWAAAGARSRRNRRESETVHAAVLERLQRAACYWRAAHRFSLTKVRSEASTPLPARAGRVRPAFPVRGH